MSVRVHTIAFLFMTLLGFDPLPGQPSTGPALVGHTENNQYISPTGAFRVAIPVVGSLGGSISDTESVVTFQDDFNTHQSIACFKMDTTQRFEDDARGRKEYLVWFFSNFVQADFENRFPGSRIESAQFIHDLKDGALLVYNLLPGGSMFSHRAISTGFGAPPEAKRGNLIFVEHGNIFVLSIELAEKVLEGPAFTTTVPEQDAILRKRLLNLLSKMSFTESDNEAQPPATAKTYGMDPASKDDKRAK